MPPIPNALVRVATVLWLLHHATALAQTPEQQPLVQPGSLAHLGKFTLPASDGTGRGAAEGALTWGGSAIGLGPDGRSLYFGCHDWGARMARVSIPDLGGVASVVEPCAPVANLVAVNTADPAGPKKLGGSLWWNGRLIVSAYVFYDGGGTAVASHFASAGPIDALTGPYRVGPENPGLVGGYMGVIPPEWRGLLGGPALTGQCCLSIISRSSFGPSAHVFNPDDVGRVNPVPSKMLVGYPNEHQTLGGWDNTTSNVFNSTAVMGGIAFPSGTRSLLFVERHGTTFCYGSGTGDPALHGKPHEQGGVWCYDPIASAKGVHGYPYTHKVVAYDANDLLAVKRKRKDPWDLKPYAVWTLTEMNGGQGTASMRSAAYDPATRRWYIVEDSGEWPSTVHVYEVTTPVLPAPAPGPQGFSAQVGQAGLVLSWMPPATASPTGYKLEVSSSTGAADLGALPLSAALRSLTLPTRLSGPFYLRLWALYPDGTSGASTEVRVTRDLR